MKMILATNNQGKVNEFKAILKGHDIFSLKDCDIKIDVEENGNSFQENALIKARAVSALTGEFTIADDSGLIVDCLGDEPGIYSARYAGIHASDQDNIDKLLKRLEQETDLSARFVAAIAGVFPNGRELVTLGECKGEMIRDMRGSNGFGYDPIFYLPQYRKTFAELEPEIKNKISHRSNALKKFIKELERFI